MRKSGRWGTVGGKPKTTCTALVERIHQESLMQHQVAGIWFAVGRATHVAAFGIRQLEQKNLEFACRGTNWTKWRTLTMGTVRLRVVEYGAIVASPGFDLPCGA